MGWLLYSHWNIYLEHLKYEFFWQREVTVGLRYWVAKPGEYRKGNVPPKGPVRAIHIKVFTQEMAKAEQLIRDAYAADNHDFPRGIWMQLIPKFSGYLNMKLKEKLKHLAVKQHAWISNVRTAKTWEMVLLDMASKENGKFIQEMIMWVLGRTAFLSFLSHFQIFLTLF